MDEILKGTLSSNHSQEMKMVVIDRIIESIQSDGSKDAIAKMLEVCLKIIASSKTEFDITMTKRILNAIARTHPEEVVNFLHQELNLAFENGLFQQGDLSDDKKTLLELVSHVLSLTGSICHDHLSVKEMLKTVVSCFLAEKSVIFCAMLAEIVIQNWKEDIIAEKGNDLLDKMIKILSRFSLKVDPRVVESPVMEISKRVYQVNIISSLFSKIIEMNEKYVSFALREIFQILCQNETPASITLAPLLTSIPEGYAKFAADTVCNNHLIKDINFERVLCKLIDWLAWPASQNLDAWIITLSKNLLTDRKRHRLVAEVIRKKAVVVFNHMFCEVSRESALAVFSFMMMAYQHSSEIFQKVAPRIPALFDLIEKHPKPNQDILKALTELVCTLVFMFPGSSDIHINLLSTIKNYPQPSIVDMKRWLLRSPVIELDVPIIQTENSQSSKHILGKTGLNNLGNTCYMNSVIQALFMLKSFRSKLLSMSLTSVTEPVTYNMARLFAFMLLSERAAISPTEFYRTSRPPWFRPGAQQDCSEFLKHFIDVLEREDKARHEKETKEDGSVSSEPKIYDWFTGECKVDVKCRKCGVVSSRFEAFSDVPLAFPDAVGDQKRAFPLKGGDISRSISKGVNGDLQHSEKPDVLEAAKATDTPQAPKPFTFHSPRELQADPPPLMEEKPLNLQELLYSYLSTEVLHGQNQYRCDNCSSLEDAEQTHFLTMCPKFLILTLKRFTYDAKTHRRGKIMENVQFPYELTVPILSTSRRGQNIEAVVPNATDDCTMDCESTLVHCEDDDDMPPSLGDTCSSISLKPVLSVNSEENKSYSLVSVIVHAGVSSESGHYYCYCRSRASNGTEKQSESTHHVASVDTTLDKVDGNSSTEIQRKESKLDSLGANKIGEKLKDDWYLFNDSLVTRAKGSDLEKIQTNHPRDTPYVFIYEESSSDDTHSIKDEAVNLWALEVESDNNEFRKEQHMMKRPLIDSIWQSKSRKWDDDKSDDSGGGSFGNCGGGHSSLGSNAGKFIY